MIKRLKISKYRDFVTATNQEDISFVYDMLQSENLDGVYDYTICLNKEDALFYVDEINMVDGNHKTWYIHDVEEIEYDDGDYVDEIRIIDMFS